MLFKVIILVFLILLLNYIPIAFNFKIGVLVFFTMISFLIDFFVLKRVEFYKLLTISLLLLINITLIYLFTQILNMLPNDSLMDIDEKNALVIFFLTLAIYTSFQVGSSSTYFRKKKPPSKSNEITKHLIDTSAIIDGRLLEISKSGFIPKSLVIPNFVIRELQLISDSSNNEKRSKGRRGLELLKQMKNSDHLSIQIVDEDVKRARNVDSKLLALAAEKDYKIITTDFNLFKVAQVEGVEALNINHLASLIKPILSINDRLKVFINKKGNNKGQGLAFLPDDTMVVVENAGKYIGFQKMVVVTSYVQNESGKMVFAKLIE